MNVHNPHLKGVRHAVIMSVCQHSDTLSTNQAGNKAWIWMKSTRFSQIKPKGRAGNVSHLNLWVETHELLLKCCRHVGM